MTTKPIVRFLVLLSFFLLPSLASAAETVVRPEPHAIMVAPFILLLLAIALVPFINKHFWEKNYHKIAMGLGLIAAAYYVVVLRNTPRIASLTARTPRKSATDQTCCRAQ